MVFIEVSALFRRSQFIFSSIQECGRSHPWPVRRGLPYKRHPRYRANGQRFRKIRAAQSPRLIQAGSSGPLAVLLIKLEVTIVERGELALDEEIAHLRGDLERVAGGNDEIGNLAGFQRAEVFVEA